MSRVKQLLKKLSMPEFTEEQLKAMVNQDTREMDNYGDAHTAGYDSAQADVALQVRAALAWDASS